METKQATGRFGVVRRMRRGLDEFAGRRIGRRGRIPVAVERRDGGFVVRADLPGYDRRDLAVTAYPDRIRIVAGGERNRATGGGSRTGPSRPRLERTVDLPAEIDEASAVADYRAGTLTITAHERRPSGERALPIRTTAGERGRTDTGEGNGVDGETARAEGAESTADRADTAGRRPMGPTDEEVREYEARADEQFDRQRDFQRDKSGHRYRRG